MESPRYVQPRHYVSVSVVYDIDGKITPKTVYFDGAPYHIDRVLDVRRAACTKAGGVGIRYLCQIGRVQSYLFYDENSSRWFVEPRRY